MASASTGLHRVSVRLIHSGATSSVHSPPPCGEGLGVGVHMKEREPPPPTPPPHSQRKSAARGGGEYIESAAPIRDAANGEREFHCVCCAVVHRPHRLIFQIEPVRDGGRKVQVFR